MEQHLADHCSRARPLQLCGLSSGCSSARKHQARQDGRRLHDRQQHHDVGLERLSQEIQQRNGRGEGDNAHRPIVRRHRRGVGGIDPGRPPQERVGHDWKQRAEQHRCYDGRENRAAKAAVRQLDSTSKPDCHHQVERDTLRERLWNRQAGLQAPGDEAEEEKEDDRRDEVLKGNVRYVHSGSRSSRNQVPATTWG